MTDISEAAKLKACELANEAMGVSGLWTLESFGGTGLINLLARYIQQVSDVAKWLRAEAAKDAYTATTIRIGVDRFDPFILPDPADPLAEALIELDTITGLLSRKEYADMIRHQLAKRGLEIREVQP